MAKKKPGEAAVAVAEAPAETVLADGGPAMLPNGEAPPLPPVAKAAAPRIVYQRERAPDGFRRVKLRAQGVEVYPWLYVLLGESDTLDDAKRVYAESQSFDPDTAGVGKGDAPGPVKWHAVELAD